uniref:Fibronectin type-III domain-containing protein n=1 Tax=Acrobeloides nanus TaxID=290746 RepID=A0A914CF30_9BILA
MLSLHHLAIQQIRVFFNEVLHPSPDLDKLPSNPVISAPEFWQLKNIYALNLFYWKMLGNTDLTVQRPPIALYTLEVGSHYIALAWNDSLKIRATDRVRLYLNVKDSMGLTSRAIQLSLHNPWFSYNVMRLKSDQNYTFCLTYLLTEYGKEKLVYESCLYEKTLPNISFWNSLNLSTIITFFVILFIVFSLLCFRAIYFRFHLWHQAKYRARMNQSISGQSFLSRTSSANGHAISNSVTFENTSQLGTSHSMYRFSIASSNNNNNLDCANGRLLTVEDAAV